MQLEWPQRNRTFGFLDVLGLLGLLGLVTARYVPVARLPFWGCALRATTGWPCPGCGLTRVAEAVSHGELAKAWGINPLATGAAVTFALLAALALLHLAFRMPVPKVQLSRPEATAVRVCLVVLVVFNYAYVVAKAKWLVGPGWGAP